MVTKKGQFASPSSSINALKWWYLENDTDFKSWWFHQDSLVNVRWHACELLATFFIFDILRLYFIITNSFLVFIKQTKIIVPKSKLKK